MIPKNSLCSIGEWWAHQQSFLHALISIREPCCVIPKWSVKSFRHWKVFATNTWEIVRVWNSAVHLCLPSTSGKPERNVWQKVAQILRLASALDEHFRWKNNKAYSLPWIQRIFSIFIFCRHTLWILLVSHLIHFSHIPTGPQPTIPTMQLSHWY